VIRSLQKNQQELIIDPETSKPRNLEHPADRKSLEGVKSTALKALLKILRLGEDIKVSLRQRWWNEMNYTAKNAAGESRRFFKNTYF
jgi:hypothetical protein